MKRAIMHDHLTREQIAALLDEPEAVPGGSAHLDACAECGAEFEGMSRMRMALSGLPDLAAPEGQWERIQAQLPTATVDAARSDTGSDAGSDTELTLRPSGALARLRTALSSPLAAAAVLALFMGGLTVGRMLAPGGDAATAGVDRSAEPGEAARPAPGGDAFTTLTGDPGGATPEEIAAYPEYFRTVSDLQRLREAGPSGPRMREDPALAAERLTRLDALIVASREALRSAPADPALNDFLFDVSDERASLAGQLNQTLRQASMEY
jgi:hypothetical protein